MIFKHRWTILIYYEQFIVSYKNNHILELNILKSLRCGCFYVIFITKIANIAINLNNENLFELVLNVDDGFIKIKFEDVIIECLKRDWA